MTKLSTPEIAAAGLADWRKLAQALHARYRVPDFAAGAAFVAAIAEAARAVDHHPDVRLSPGVVDLALGTREDGLWVTDRDVELARTISALAADRGLAAAPDEVTQLELALDTARAADIAPFWAALLTGSADNLVHGEVFDPTGRVPWLWFQQTEEHDAPRQRWHFDVSLAPEAAQQRIAAAVAAGGTVVDDSEAPSFTVLADADGNKACICTSLGRE